MIYSWTILEHILWKGFFCGEHHEFYIMTMTICLYIEGAIYGAVEAMDVI